MENRKKMPSNDDDSMTDQRSHVNHPDSGHIHRSPEAQRETFELLPLIDADLCH